MNRYVVSVEIRDRGAIGSFRWVWGFYCEFSEGAARKLVFTHLHNEGKETRGVVARVWPYGDVAPRRPGEVPPGSWPLAGDFSIADKTRPDDFRNPDDAELELG